MNKTICIVLSALMLTGCMGKMEYALRKEQLRNQAAHKQTYEPFKLRGPVALTLDKGGELVVQAQTRDFDVIPVPDGAATVAGAVVDGVKIGAVAGLAAFGIHELSRGAGNVTTSGTAINKGDGTLNYVNPCNDGVVVP